MKYLFKTITLLGVFIIFLFSKGDSYAASVYLSPASKTVYQGVNFSVAVRMSSGGDLVNAAQANLSYSSDKIEFVGIGGGGSAFSIAAPSGGGGGNVNISRGVIGTGVGGDKLIATVTFRPKSGATGTASISVVGGTSLVRGSDQANIFTGGSGGTYTIAPASSAPASSPSSGTTTSSPAPTLAPLVITNVKVNNLSYNNADITWTTNRPATSIVEFGLTQNYGLTSEESTPSANHSVSLSSDFLTAGSTYHYRVKSIDSKDEEAVSPDSTFVIPGITLRIEVQNADGSIVSEQEVSLVTPEGVKKATTDVNGIAEFSNLAAITYTVLVGENASVVDVKAPTDNELAQDSLSPQSTVIKIAGASYKSLPSSTLVGAIGAILIGLSIIFLILRRFVRIRRQNNPPSSTNPTVV